jgi:putative ABC transport system permease protein
MPLLPRLTSLWRNLFRKSRKEQELADEIRAHLEMLIELKIREGLGPAEARRAALIELGGEEQVKESVREMRTGHQLETWWQDLRYAMRVMRRTPGFTLIAILTLMLGIGANSAIFSVVNAVLMRSLPYRDPDRLVLLSYHRASEGVSAATARSFVRWRIQTRSFEQISGYRTSIVDLTGSGEPEQLEAGIISADLFATLGLTPALGRAFTPDEDAAGGPLAVILSDGLWRRHFGADPQVIGRALTIGGQSRTIVGIMPPGFPFLKEAELWLPLALNLTEELKPQGPTFRMNVLARLKPGITLEAARADLSVTLKREQQEFPRASLGLQPVVVGLNENLVGNVRSALLVLFGAVVFVLLIACANVANLLLARSAARQKEMAIRAAVGAGRLRLVRQLLTESLLLSSLGGAAGLIAAKWGIKLLVAMSPAGIARIEESGLDGRVFGLAASVRNQVRAIEPNEPVGQIVTMDDSLSKSVAGRRFQMLLLGIFAAVALIIATVGIYGVISYAVSQRMREIGIRMALGAQAGDVLRMIVWRGISLTMIGIALGVAAALALTRIMKNLLFNVSATDPATFALIALLLIVVALIASYIPARRATKVDPITVLKSE